MGLISRFQNPVVGVIGGTGMMGSWFADISEKSGAKVLRVGRKTKITIQDVLKSCNVIVISVPIAVTQDIIKKVGPFVQEDSLLIDLTSVKKMPIETMLKYSKSEVVGLHPLFGVDIDPGLVKRVVVCHGRGEAGKKWVSELLTNAGFELVFLDPEEHDKLMGLIQGVNHFETISLALRIKDSGIRWEDLERTSTQTFIRKLNRIKKMFEQDPELFASLLVDNEWSIKWIDLYMRDALSFFNIIKRKDKEEIKKIFLSIRKFLAMGGDKDERDMGKS